MFELTLHWQDGTDTVVPLFDWLVVVILFFMHRRIGELENHVSKD